MSAEVLDISQQKEKYYRQRWTSDDEVGILRPEGKQRVDTRRGERTDKIIIEETEGRQFVWFGHIKDDG